MKLPGEKRGFLRPREAEDGPEGGEVTAGAPTAGDLPLAPVMRPKGPAGGLALACLGPNALGTSRGSHGEGPRAECSLKQVAAVSPGVSTHLRTDPVASDNKLFCRDHIGLKILAQNLRVLYKSLLVT